MPITITEALAEIKTIGKRIEKKREYIVGFIGRQDGLRDPLEKDGGSFTVIQNERQSISDLEKRVVVLRRSIQRANDETMVSVGGINQSISDWLIWRRDVSPNAKSFLNKLRSGIEVARSAAKRSGSGVVMAGEKAEKPTDIIINVNESTLAEDIEKLETILGELDGQLSLKNATVQIRET